VRAAANVSRRATEQGARVTAAADARGSALTKARGEVEAAQRAAATEVREGTRGLNKSVTREFATAPKETLTKIINSPDGARKLKQLMDQGADPAMVRGLFTDFVRNKVVTREQGKAAISPQAAKNIAEARPFLETLFQGDAAAMRQIDEAVNMANVERTRGLSRASELGHGPPSEAQQVAASAGAALGLNQLTGSSSLVLANSLRKFMLKVVKGDIIDQTVVKRMAELSTDPAAFIRAVDSVPPPTIPANASYQETVKLLTEAYGADVARAIVIGTANAEDLQ
jgi:hypothetical protein